MKLLWLTDLHLDRADNNTRHQLLNTLASAQFDSVLITGDISNSANVCTDLSDLASACGGKMLYFVLGNHDFFGSSFIEVDAAVSKVCEQQKNLKHLGQGETIPLASDTALVGHRGWADGRAGYGSQSLLRNPDADMIADLGCKTKAAMFDKMEGLGKASAHYFRKVLPYALTSFRNVWVATHVPPFPQSTFYDGKQCGPLHSPYYTNVAAGKAINGIAQRFPKRHVTVLSGHTHSSANTRIAARVTCRVGDARSFSKQGQRVLEAA